MKKTLLTSLAALGLSALSAAGYAAPPPIAPPVAVYDGKPLAQDKLDAADWGGGTVADSTELFLFGGHSLKVTTLDPYQGAKISLQTPVALSGNDRMFQLTLQRGSVTLHYDPQTVPGAVPADPQAGPGGTPGNYPGGTPGNYPGGPGGFGGRGRGRSPFGGFQRGFPGGQGGFRGRGRFGRGGAAAPLIPLITKLRLEFTLADGRKADVYQPIPDTADPVAGTGWYSVNVPLSSLKFGPGAMPMLKSVTVAGDQFGVFFIGQMQVAALVTTPPTEIKTALPEETPVTFPEGDLTPMDDQPLLPPGERTTPPDETSSSTGREE